MSDTAEKKRRVTQKKQKTKQKSAFSRSGGSTLKFTNFLSSLDVRRPPIHRTDVPLLLRTFDEHSLSRDCLTEHDVHRFLN